MAEPDSTGTSETATLPAIASDAVPARLSCFSCKKRKVKCDRQHPICSLCRKLTHVCEYPTGPSKPGPKARSLYAPKRRRLDDRPKPISSAQGLSFNPVWQVQSDPFGLTKPTPSESDGRSYSVSDGVSHNNLPNREHLPGTPSAPIFSHIMYPSPEAQEQPHTPYTPAQQNPITAQSVCAALDIRLKTYDILMDLYFTNMTSFSLFRPGIESKFSRMQHSHAEALVAAMFSFSARHWVDRASDCPSPTYFAHIATSQLDLSIDRCGDMRPPFWVLQACILVTFYQLTLSVRSRSWNRLGQCVRYSYDLNLHLVDANYDPTSTGNSPADIKRRSLLEEQRRAWWAVWEMDIFASTIRRLPTAIDGSENFTMLPVPDRCWFNDIYQESCFLSVDCSLRWKYLAESGNQSSKAWFLVINSLMRNTQRIVYPAGSAMQSLNHRHFETNQDELNIMANSLSCTLISLPVNLSYQGETLHFRQTPSPLDLDSRQQQADKFSLHLMTQLCRFMIYHHKICARAPWLAKKHLSDDPGSTAQANFEWSNYMNASDEIVTLVRNSARDHYRYVNPFLTNSLWFGAAAQCACQVFGPSSFNKRLTSSNLELLRLTIDRYISFWNGMENLKRKLARIEVGLKSLMASSNNVASESGQQPAQESLGDGARSTTFVPENENAGSTPTDPGATPGIGSLLVPDMAANNWAGDTRWPSFVPDLCNVTQPFTMEDCQNFIAKDQIDFSPYGLEELLIAGINHHI